MLNQISNSRAGTKTYICVDWEYKKLVGIMDLIKAFEADMKNKFEIAEYLNVTEKFLKEAIQYYSTKYGVSYELDNYIIYFKPNLAILKMFK